MATKKKTTKRATKRLPEPDCNMKVCREKYPDEDRFQAMSSEGKLAYLFEQNHFLKRELRVASRRADMLTEHTHDGNGQPTVSMYRLDRMLS